MNKPQLIHIKGMATTPCLFLPPKTKLFPPTLHTLNNTSKSAILKDMINLKKCTKCKTKKHRTLFYKSCNTDDLRTDLCIKCTDTLFNKGFRTCSQCNIIKPLEDFYRLAGCRGGVAYTCKTCARPDILKNNPYTTEEQLHDIKQHKHRFIKHIKKTNPSLLAQLIKKNNIPNKWKKSVQ